MKETETPFRGAIYQMSYFVIILKSWKSHQPLI